MDFERGMLGRWRCPKVITTQFDHYPAFAEATQTRRGLQQDERP